MKRRHKPATGRTRSSVLALLALGAICMSVGPGRAQSLPSYYERSGFLAAPPAAVGDGLLGFANPANLALLAQPELRFYWSTEGDEVFSIGDWGAFTGSRHLGFAVQRQLVADVGVTDFKLSTAGGTRALAWGVGYGWSSGKRDAVGRAKLISVGAISRPSRYWSLGVTGNFTLEDSESEGIVELGWRPLGTPQLTFFADAAARDGVRLVDSPWSIGAAAEVAPGVRLVGRYFESEAFTLGLSLNLGSSGSGAGGQSHFDSDAKHAFTSHYVRVGGQKPSFANRFGSGTRYVPFSLKGRTDYLKFKHLDSGTNRLLDLLRNIQAATNDHRVAALAVNLSGMRIRSEHGWEVREALGKAKAAGKKVVVFIDRPGMTGYHLASVADKIVMDPEGSMMLSGYATSRTYFKGMLEKLGLGFDEWRFFKYKSANETFSRDSMSEADREQRQTYVEDLYESTRADVCTGRGLTTEQFDALIDTTTFFMAEDALSTGLVDTLGRWSDRDAVLRDLNGQTKGAIGQASLLANSVASPAWGSLPKIAVVYALGVCAMDEGINARHLEQVVNGLTNSKAVKAVVLRVDSPGGDGLASDVVAQALRKCSAQKPVIISQGQVAASGGYWLSAYGDKILAGPGTVTGSIGVIFGWVYDKGFGEKFGLSSDLVQRGKHADLGQGIRIPFTPLTVPARNLTPDERKKAERIIRRAYDHFVKIVAEGRGISDERVREIGEGRVYSGVKGKELGLVDEIGGLLAALSLAKAEAGLAPDAEVKIIEIPDTKGFFNLQQVSPVSVQVADEPVVKFIKLVTEKRGAPLPVLIPGTYPEFEQN